MDSTIVWEAEFTLLYDNIYKIKANERRSNQYSSRDTKMIVVLGT